MCSNLLTAKESKTSFSPLSLVRLDYGRRQPIPNSDWCPAQTLYNINPNYKLSTELILISDELGIMDVSDQEYDVPKLTPLKGHILPVPTVQETNPTFEFGSSLHIFFRAV
jgi:hypothetical protein